MGKLYCYTGKKWERIGKDGKDGKDGKPGKDAKEVELRKFNDKLQWRRRGEKWKDLITLNNLGAAASAGAGGGAVVITGVTEIIAGTNITIDNTNPQKPIISATGGGGGAVDSVNGQTGVVILSADDITDTATNRFTNDTDIARLANTSGTNTGDQDLSELVPNTRTVNGKALSSDITLDAADVGALATVQAGTNVTIDDTDPQNPIINASGGSGVDGFAFQDYDKTSSHVYVGYEHPDDRWYIYRRTVANNAREYAQGSSGYDFSNRASEVYI